MSTDDLVPGKVAIPRRKWWQELTVEPTIFFFYTTYVMIDLVNINLYLQKACRLNATSEPNLDTPCDDEKLGITFVSDANSKYKFILVVATTIVVALASSWSDEMGKKVKLLIIVPIIGQILQLVSACVQSYFWYWSPTVAIRCDVFFQIASGGHVLFLSAVMLYISTISTPENRTMRTGILMSFEMICMPIGSGLSGFLLHKLGFLRTYALGLISTCISLVLAVKFIKDVSAPTENKTSFLQFFNFLRIARGFKIFLNKSLKNKKIIVILLLITHITVWFGVEGEKTVVYLYFRYRFKWNEQVYGYYLVYKLIGTLFGTTFCSIVLSKYFKVHDGIIGAFAAFFDVMAVVFYYFAYQSSQLYIIALLHIFQGTAIAVHYSFISKYFENHEFGRLTASLNTLGLVVPISHPLYAMIFQKTMDSLPSAFYLVSIFFNTIVCLLYGAAYYFHKKTER